MSFVTLELTQTIQIDKHPFIARLRWLIARTLGWPPLREVGGFSVLNVSYTFNDT